MKHIWFLMLTLWLALGQINVASAHGLEAGQLSVLLDNVNAAIIAAPYTSAFPFADENGNGLLSADELSQLEEAIYAFSVFIKAKEIHRNVFIPARPDLVRVQGYQTPYSTWLMTRPGLVNESPRV